MPPTHKLISRLPIPKAWRSRWLAVLSQRWYRTELANARATKDRARIEELEWAQREDDRMEFEEDAIIFTKQLLRSAARLRVPTPRVFAGDGELTEFWYQSHIFGDLYLTELGIAKVREAIRQEVTWRDQRRSNLVAWIAALTGIIGAITGLLAVIFSAK